jgi:4-carboxymuconolactone decarboxylase
MMQDYHEVFTRFKEEFPRVYAEYATMGREIHESSGPLTEKIRWLVKIVISGATGHHRALATHIRKGREAGLKDDEIKHALLMLIPTTGFPTFMKAYKALNDLK